jgi:hypothetical protein
MALMRPPIFSARPGGSGPQQYLHRARMFRDAASSMPSYSSAEPNWPRYALLTHAIELSLKAFALHSLENGASPRTEPGNHDLVGWYRLAIDYGLEPDDEIQDHLAVLNELHETHFARYPQNRGTPLPDPTVIADTTVEHLISTFTRSINPR